MLYFSIFFLVFNRFHINCTTYCFVLVLSFLGGFRIIQTLACIILAFSSDLERFLLLISHSLKIIISYSVDLSIFFLVSNKFHINCTTYCFVLVLSFFGGFRIIQTLACIILAFSSDLERFLLLISHSLKILISYSVDLSIFFLVSNRFH